MDEQFEYSGEIEEENEGIDLENLEDIFDDVFSEDEEILSSGNKFPWGNGSYGNSTAVQYIQTREVKIPKAGNMFALDAAQIQRIERLCKEAKSNGTSYSELFLGGATLFLGAFLSALLTQVPYEAKLLNIFFYTLCPAIGIALGVAYCFARKTGVANITRFANEIEECIGNLNEMDDFEEV